MGVDAIRKNKGPEKKNRGRGMGRNIWKCDG